MVVPSPIRLRYSFAWPSTKARPSTKESRNHRRSPKTSPRSAANTPNWQVNDEETRISVTTSAYGTLSSVGAIGQSPGCAARTVKYMAKSAAKNISSLDSQTMVPTLTMLGRVSECTLPSNVAVVTAASFHAPGCYTRRGQRVFAQVGDVPLRGARHAVRARGRPGRPAAVRRRPAGHREPGRPPAGGRPRAGRRPVSLGRPGTPVARGPVAGDQDGGVDGRRAGHDRGRHDERARGVRRDAVQHAHGAAHGALDGLAGVPRARRAGDAGVAHAARRGPARGAGGAAQPAGPGADVPAGRLAAVRRQPVRAVLLRLVSGHPRAPLAARVAAPALPGRRVPVLLAADRARPGARPGPAPAALPARVRRAADPRHPRPDDHEQLRADRGPALPGVRADLVRPGFRPAGRWRAAVGVRGPGRAAHARRRGGAVDARVRPGGGPDRPAARPGAAGQGGGRYGGCGGSAAAGLVGRPTRPDRPGCARRLGGPTVPGRPGRL